jgi:glycosyltransferase involved in cell wall biosynthesis
LTKILISINTSWNLYNFRAGLIRALVEAGYEVVVAAPPDDYSERLKELRCRFVPLPMSNKGINPVSDLWLLMRFWWLLRQEKPNAYLGYTVKPNIYGSISAHSLGIPVINNIAGLGAVFIIDNLLTKLVKRLYKLALSKSNTVFFQNEDDRVLFVEAGLVPAAITDRLPGSGVDLAKFAYQAPLENVGFGPVDENFVSNILGLQPVLVKHKVSFILIARMLFDKGISEYVEAACLIKARFPQVTFNLLGFLDVQNPAAISRSQMNEWVNEGVVNYLGTTDDVRPYINSTDCVVLPSYREGVPRSLLEAAAIGRPIITTNAVGCKEVVDDGVNGYLCQPRDAVDLAHKIEEMLLLSDDQRTEMGLRGREKVEREFDERVVIGKYLEKIVSINEIKIRKNGQPSKD